MDDRLLADLRAVFQEEARESLDHLRTTLQSWGGAGDVGECLRVAHNLKGASATAGLTTASEVAHLLEDFFQLHLNGASSPSAVHLKSALSALMDLEKLIDGDDAVFGAQHWRRELGLPSSVAAEREPARLALARPQATFASELSDANREPAPDEHLPEEHTPRFTRVETAHLERLLQLSLELTALAGRLSARRAGYAGVVETLASDLEGRSEPALARALGQLVELTEAERPWGVQLTNARSEFEDAITRLRMTRLDAALGSFRRVVAEAASVLGKEARLSADVGDLEVDRHVLERLHVPLVHLLRNAMAHGIEAPAERFDKGKPRCGELQLDARTNGTVVELSLRDDGAGIDVRAVAHVAQRRGFIDAHAAENLSFEQAVELLFRAGFSTSEQANTISGRGVGLHDVSKALDDLGGSISVENLDGFPGGCRFRLRFPVSNLTTRGLLVRDGGQTYALPLADVESALPSSAARVETLDGQAWLRFQEHTVPLRALRDLLGQTQGASEPALRELDVVVLKTGGRRFAVTVDDVLWDSAFVLKPLPWNLKSHPHVQGVALLPDGDYALAVEPKRFELAGGTARRAAAGVSRRRRVLVVDDSLTRRTLHCNLMRSAGYEVESAADGVQAWGLLQQIRFDMLVSDVQMPEMNGIELVQRVRKDAALRNLPVVLVTGLSDPDGERQGLNAGANAWVQKQDFAHERLLETIASLFERAR